MNDTIYPLAYRLCGGQRCTLHYLGFPKAWKAALLDIAGKSNPRFKDEYGLPTNALKKLTDCWMEGVVALAPLKKGSDDERWLTSCSAYSQKDIAALCDMIRVWVKATYVLPARVPPAVRRLANDFCDTMRPEELAALESRAEVCLTHENGTVCEEAYQAIPLLAANRLRGREIVLSGQPLRLCGAGKNQLISQPVTDSQSGHRYSFVFDLSVQTTPPQRKALLLCQMSIRRWIEGALDKARVPFLAESVNAHIRVSDSRYCQVPIAYDYDSRQVDWKAQDRACYDIWGYEPLPPVHDVLTDPAAHAARIALPYKNGMGGFVASKIGTGVSVVDKASLYRSVCELLGDMVAERPRARRISLRGQHFATYQSPQEYVSREDFRGWVRKCAETDRIVFEIYGLWKDPAERGILERIEQKLERDFGEDSDASCLRVRCVRREIGDLADAMADDFARTKIRRCDEIVAQLGAADAVTACILALPGHERYAKGDPKQVLRNAFARTGRVVQFINPEGDAAPSKIDNAVYDLYRQLGVVALPNLSKAPPLATVPCEGMHLCTHIHGIAGKGRFLPVYVTVDVLEGRTRVYCEAFSKQTVSYREACLEMAQLFWKTDLEQRCVDASRSPAKQRLIHWKNRCCQKEDGVLLVVQSDGNTRALWSGISDKEIGGYEVSDAYCPTRINAGMPRNPYPISLAGCGIRIMRIRSNQEVPDYYTDLSAKSTADQPRYSSASGVFQYDDVYWGIHARPNDPQYTGSFRASRISHPRQRFAEKDMVELYPLQLQPGDHADNWVFYTNALRHIPIQYSQSTVLPLPLHLAKALEEYLFEA